MLDSTGTTNSTPDSGVVDTWMIAVAAASGFVVLVLVTLTCICYCRWKSKNSANVRVPRTARHPTKQNHYASAPVEPESTAARGHVKKAAASQMIGDYQHSDDLENGDGINPTARLMPTTSTAGQTGVAGTDHEATTVDDALYSKVKKKKRARAAKDLYSKPDKGGKGHATNNHSGDKLHGATAGGGREAGKEDLYAKSSKQKRRKSRSENESETADELYTKSAKQKRRKNKSENESETADELYTKPAKKGKKSTQADYANYNLVKGLDGDLDVSGASGDVTQRANFNNGIMDNELYQK